MQVGWCLNIGRGGVLARGVPEGGGGWRAAFERGFSKGCSSGSGPAGEGVLGLSGVQRAIIFESGG